MLKAHLLTYQMQVMQHIQGGSSVLSGASNVLSTTTAVAAGAAWNSYEWVAGKIIGANAATQLANSVASIFGGTQATGRAIA